MKRLALFAIVAISATGHAQTEQDVQRFERHVEAHDLAPRGGNCIVSFTLNTAGYVVAMNLSKCPGKDQASALTRLAAALPFPPSSTVSRDVSIRL